MCTVAVPGVLIVNPIMSVAKANMLMEHYCIRALEPVGEITSRLCAQHSRAHFLAEGREVL